MDNPLFLLENIRYAYDRTNVLDLEYLSVSRAQITVIAGPNGAGKTTLLKVINSLLLPAGGTIRYKNELLKYMKMPGKESRIRRETVLVHQEPFVFTGSVFQNVAYGLKIRHTPHREIQKKVRENLALVGLADFEKRKASELSGGERKRMSIARALVLAPEVLLLDEPSAHVDSESLRQIETLLLEIRERTTVIVSTHNLPFAYRTGDRFVYLQEGKAVPSDVNVFKGAVDETNDDFTYFRIGSRRFICPAQSGDFKAAVLPLDDVILSDHPVQTSARNQFKGSVRSVRKKNGKYRVNLDCGFTVETFITGASIKELAVAPGRDLYVTFKAAAISLY